MAKAKDIPYAELRGAIRSIMRTVDLSSISAKKIRTLCAKKMKMSLACRRKEMDEIIMTYMEEGDSSSEDSDSEEGDPSKKVCNTKSGASHSSVQCTTPISVQFATPSSVQSATPSSVQSATPSSVQSATSIRRIAVATPPKKRILEEKRLAAQVFEAPAPAKVTTHSIPGGGGGDTINYRPKCRRCMVPPKKRPIKMPVKTSDQSPVRNEQQSLQEDELFARRLQAEEWNFRQRTVKKSLKSRAPAKQLDQNGEPKKRKAGAYSRNCRLSSSLTAVLKANQMSRYDVVKKIWHIVRTRGLFDPNNKQFAIVDEELYRVFGRHRIRLFGMMKYLKHHIKDI
ncbi:uncharacterized protein LOC129218505 isoform X1 [Uloborus diversus]|uniref:uncharacterized protein LOC129218505 isoform X1 n=1 Tax=Uloborus diversus TaxID=327109 RepID=UPI0024094DCC|nr:uncharacterized protein LOC129218505 isoform X1 [Uloborus diversus]